MRNRKKRRRAARARLFRAARARAFREHPFVCWSAIVIWVSGGALLATNAILSAMRGGQTVPLMQWGSILLMGFPVVWLGGALQLGPLSPKRRSRAEFWKGTRLVLWMLAAMSVLQLALFCVALIYGAKHIAAALSQTIPAFLWDQLRSHEGLPGLLWLLGGWAAAALVMLYAAHRLKPVVRRLEGKCVRCGYMLRGLREPRCPECGTPFNPADLADDRARQESGSADHPGG
jgi:hypothetical protein